LSTFIDLGPPRIVYGIPHGSPKGRAFEKLEDKQKKEIFLKPNYTHLFEGEEWVRREPAIYKTELVGRPSAT
jgi:hypothetical protein